MLEEIDEQFVERNLQNWDFKIQDRLSAAFCFY